VAESNCLCHSFFDSKVEKILKINFFKKIFFLRKKKEYFLFEKIDHSDCHFRERKREVREAGENRFLSCFYRHFLSPPFSPSLSPPFSLSLSPPFSLSLSLSSLSLCLSFSPYLFFISLSRSLSLSFFLPHICD